MAGAVKLKQTALSATIAVSLIGLTIWAVGTGLTTSAFTWSDASRHAMDGVLLRDLVVGGHLGHAYQYVVDYYARYPALGIGYYPPFFAMVEAVFYSVFGVSRATALATEVFFALVALAFWYALVRSTHDRTHAVLASLFLIANPFTVWWAREVMLEMPALALVIATMFFAERFSRGGGAANAYGMAVSLGLAFLTKQTAIFLVPTVLVVLASRKQLALLARRTMWGPAALAVILMAPWVAATAAFGGVNVQQSLGGLGQTLGAPPRWSFAAWSYYVRHLPDVLTLPVLALAALGLASRPKRTGLYMAWLGVFYVFVGIVSVKEARYFYLGVPPICLLAAVGAVAGLRWRPRRWQTAARVTACLAVGCALGWSGWQVARLRTPTIEGYDAAARNLASTGRARRVLVGTYDDGAMVYYLRIHDRAQRLQVFRVGKLFYATAIMEEYGFQEFVRTYADMKALLKEYGIQYVLVEEPADPEVFGKGAKLRGILEKHLRSDDFRPVFTIPVRTNTNPHHHARLVAYQFLQAGAPRRTTVDLHIPAIGRTFGAKVRGDQ